ncbi:hypothetical protein AJ80_00394 [Polytolypa hystricis UAMH7299]|uniref:F-box domain-containing protein n=1 Tax=Polytolypa hystricis (strain UAMH7299) TaxID=1447883 RepID=A0A2B7YUU4_POLH7|nr:hypothetical protein AJ80_00394 [Polytolypa hystricis UAMH7299]
MARQWFKRWCKPSVNQVAASDVALFLLPEDLLFMVCQYLTCAEAVTLMLSCTHFWHSRIETGVFAKIWQQMTTSPAGKGLSNIMTARFYVLRMLEYDGLLQQGSPSKYCCWGCMKPHEQQAFSRNEFKKKVELKSKEDCFPRKVAHRSCVLGKRYIWIGLCREMSLVELRYAVAHPLNGRSYVCDNHESFTRGCSLLDPETGQFEYSFVVGRPTDVSSFDDFCRHLRAVNVPLCPHLRLGDWELVQWNRWPQMQPYNCKHCPTTVRIETFQMYVTVRVFRYVGSLCSPKDPAWMAQSYQARHRRLKGHCQMFYNWFGITNKRIMMGEGYSRFQPSMRKIRRPFKGVRVRLQFN